MTAIHSPDGGWDPAVAIALNFADQKQHPAITTALTLDAALAAITREPIDTSVAQAKLAWWASEFERFSLGRAQHPLTQTLADLSVPVAQMDFWLRLLAAHQTSLASSTAEAHRGAAFGALAQLLGAGEAQEVYEAIGGAAGPFLAPATPGLGPSQTTAHAKELALASGRLAALRAPARDRFMFVLAAVAERRARAVAKLGDAGLQKPGPLALLWVSWRAAIKTRA